MEIIIKNRSNKEVKIEGFEHLHRHSHFSLLDGFSTVEELGERSKTVNQKYLAITDHGMLAATPNQIKCAEKYNLKPIFGIEFYCNPLQPELKEGEDSSDFYKLLNEDEKKKFRKSYHLLAIAYSDKGYENLVKLSSIAWTKGFYYKPRVNHEQLLKYKEGIIFTSCCYNSEIGQAFDQGGDEAGFQMVEKYLKMFGSNFYLEIMLLDFKKQKPYDIFILKAHQRYGIPIILSNDTHYTLPEDSKYQRLMLMIQTKKTLEEVNKKSEEQDSDLFELQDTNLWMKSEEELNDKWLKDYSDVIEYDIFKQSKLNTVEICKRACNVKLDRSSKLPNLPYANRKLMESIMIGFKYRCLPYTKEYLNRLKEEYELICDKEFASYFLIQKMMTDEARRISPILLGWGTGHEAVGPGRGSSVGSLICYCLGITDVDPIKHDLLFSRFLSPARGGKSMKLHFTIDPIKNDIKKEEEKIKTLDIDECPFEAN